MGLFGWVFYCQPCGQGGGGGAAAGGGLPARHPPTDVQESHWERPPGVQHEQAAGRAGVLSPFGHSDR